MTVPGIFRILQLQCLVSACFLCGASITNCSTGDTLCEAHYFRGQNCSEKVLYQKFSSLYRNTDGRFPGKPENFVVEPFIKVYRDGSNRIFSGAKVVITTPKIADPKDTRGFQLIYYPISEEDQVRCVIFNFPNTLTAQDSKVNVSREIYPLYKGLFFFKAYSLPKPLQSESKFRGYFFEPYRDFITTSLPSSDWSTPISYFNDSTQREILIRFSRPPQEYHFILFNVELWKNNEMIDTATISETEYKFSNLTPGTYEAKIAPKENKRDLVKDPFFKNCLCKNRRHKCEACTATRTGPIIIQNISTTHRYSTTPPQTTYTSDPISMNTTTELPQGSDLTGVSQVTVIIIVFGLVLIVIVVVASFTILQRRKFNAPDMRVINYDINHKVTRGDGAASFLTAHLESGIKAIPNARVLQHKKVFILYAEDHPAHVDVIKSFAVFLSTHCRCEVIFAPWCMSEVNQDKIRWIMRSFDRASYTIVINSLSAYHQFKSGKRLRSAHDSPLADMFYLGINQIHHRVCLNSAYGKLINVCFEYTKKEFFIDDLCAGAQYVLMKHLQDLLCHIHSVNQQTTQMKDVGLAFVEDITVLPEGNTLVKNLQTATLYEISHPQWFEQDCFDSGVDSAENFPIEDRNTIKEDYERNFTREKRMDDSISKIIENQDKILWNIPVETDIESSEAFTYIGEPSQNLECAYSPSFVAPSDIGEPPDICSNYLLNEIEKLNNKYVKNTQLHIDKSHTSMGLNGEECISLGGHSV